MENFKQQNLFTKILIVIFWLIAAVFAFWPALFIVGLALCVLAAFFAILFIFGVASLPIAAAWWLFNR